MSSFNIHSSYGPCRTLLSEVLYILLENMKASPSLFLSQLLTLSFSLLFNFLSFPSVNDSVLQFLFSHLQSPSHTALCNLFVRHTSHVDCVSCVAVPSRCNNLGATFTAQGMTVT